MGRGRPWLLVGSVVMVAILVAFALGSDPPRDNPDAALGARYETVRRPIDVPDVVVSDTTSQSGIYNNDIDNITAIWVRGTIVLEDVRGSGRLDVLLDLQIPGNHTRSDPVRMYECGTGISPPILDACGEDRLEADVVFFDPWHVGRPPTATTAGQGVQPLAAWVFSLAVTGTGNAEAERITFNADVEVEYYRLADD